MLQATKPIPSRKVAQAQGFAEKTNMPCLPSSAFLCLSAPLRQNRCNPYNSAESAKSVVDSSPTHPPVVVIPRPRLL